VTPVAFFFISLAEFLSLAPERCSTRVSSGLTNKYYTSLKKLARDERSSLFFQFVMDEQKVL